MIGRFIVLTLALTFAWARPVIAQSGPGNVGVQSEVAQAAQWPRRPPVLKRRVFGMISLGFDAATAAGLKHDPGEASVWRASAAVGINIMPNSNSMFSATSELERSEYEFSEVALAAGMPRVGEAMVRRAAVTFRSRVVGQWAVLGSADLTSSTAAGGSWDKGITGGGMIALRYRPSNEVGLSLGILARTRLGEPVIVLPIPGIDWRITERLSLRTAQGLTFSYALQPGKWFLDVSGSYESRAYRLGDVPDMADGVMIDRRIPVQASLRFQPSPAVQAAVFAGALAWQRYEFIDASGEDVVNFNAGISGFAGFSARTLF